MIEQENNKMAKHTHIIFRSRNAMFRFGSRSSMSYTKLYCAETYKLCNLFGLRTKTMKNVNRNESTLKKWCSI